MTTKKKFRKNVPRLQGYWSGMEVRGGAAKETSGNKKNLLLAVAVVLLVSIAFVSGFFLEGWLQQKPKTPDIGTEAKSLRQLVTDKTLSATIDIVAVKESENTGMVSRAEVEIISGKGRALFSINPFVEPDTQESAEISRVLAQAYTGIDLSEKDVIYSITGVDARTRLVGGPSAGAAMALATIAALEGKKVRKDATITGMIYPDGSIRPVGGIIEKAEAAARQGKKLFLVPKGEAMLTYYAEDVSERMDGQFLVRTINYVPKTLDIAKYAKENWGLEVKEVSNIWEAAVILLES